MKNIFAFACSLLIFAGASAQIDRTKAPAPGPAPKIQIPTAQSFTLKNGLRVFVVENHKIPKVSYSLFLDIPAQNEGDKAGVSYALGDMLSRGTTTRTKAQIDEEMDFIGADFATSSNGFFGSCLKKHNEKLLEVIADVLLNPSFPQEEFDKFMKQTITGLQSEKNSPTAIINNMRSATIYAAGHPYAEVATEKTMGNITVADVQNYYKANFIPNSGYLAIVGDITLEEAKALMEKYFGAWAKGTPAKTKIPAVTAPENPQVVMFDRGNSTQTSLRFAYPVQLKTGDADAIKVSVLANILGGGSTGRLYKNLRETHGYTYGAYCGFKSDPNIGYFTASAEVRTAVTDSAVYEFIREFSLMNSKGVTAEELAATKKEMEGDFARSLESPSTVAQFAINIARYKLPANYYQNYLVNLNAITVEEMNAVAKEYIRPYNYYLLVVGVKDSIANNLTKYDSDQKILFVDNYGVPVKEIQPVPEGVTLETVLNGHITAIGGKDAVAGVQDFKIAADVNFQGYPLSATTLYKSTGLGLNTIVMSGQTVSSQLVKDGTGKSTDMQAGSKTMTSVEVKEFIGGLDPGFEMNYANYGYTAVLKGIASTDMGDAYLVEWTDAAGEKSKAYYSVKNGYKVMEVSYEKGPDGSSMKITAYLGDYRDVKGVKFAYSRTVDQGGTIISITPSSIEINTGLSDDLFK